ncbi:MAG: domain containing protein [Pedosphaera sp.]|nr:domain containing protein [Pedosphaera sp.]
MYRIIGADQKEYGPVSADELRNWIREGRANAQSRVQTEGSAEWRPLAAFPEFATDLAAAHPPSPPAFSATPPPHKTNGMAIAGLVCSLLAYPCCGIGLFSLLGLIFSGTGLAQINRNPSQGGKNLAIAGIILSLLALLLSMLVWLAFLIPNVYQNSDFHF